MSSGIGADSEFGCLRTALMHRPGRELSRITPRTKYLLRLPTLPWLSRAQQEHDFLTEILRDHGVDVIYLTGLLQDVLAYGAAREEAIASALATPELGDELALAIRRYLDALGPEDLASALTAGLTAGELRSGRGLVYDLLDPRDFVIEPLPNLVFSRNSTTWIGDQVIVGNLPGTRRRECDLLAAIYRHHPRFGGVKPVRVAGSPLDCGDVVLLGPGVVAVGVGQQSAPASVEVLARHLLGTGAVNHVVAVPMSRLPADSTLDLACTVLASGVVLMTPALAFTLTALTLTGRPGELTISRPRPFLEAAARALRIEKLTVIGTGIESGNWDDGSNTLVIDDRQLVCDERNSQTNARLASTGLNVITVPNGELGGFSGGPRARCVPLLRDSALRDSALSDSALSDDKTIPPAAVALPASRAVSAGQLARLG